MRTVFSKYIYILLSVVVVIFNLVYMHFCICGVAPRIIDQVQILSSCLFDATVLLIFFEIIFCGNIRLSCWGTYLASLLVSLSNVIYSRFFHTYLTIDCFSVVNDFGLSFYLQYLGDAFSWTDIIFLIPLGLFLAIQHKILPLHWSRIVFCNLALFFLVLFLYSSVSVVKNQSLSFFHNFDNFAKELSLHPKQTISEKGVLLTQCFSVWENNSLVALSKEDLQYIDSCYFFKETNHGNTFECKKNVIIILVESLLSCVSDLKVDGNEVTPFLNSLKQRDYTYYNGNVESNVSIGESSDGQFIYLTGLLPLENVYTINYAKNNILPSISRLLRDEFGYKTYMTIPTAPDCWQQQKMCYSYGIDSLFSSYDYEKNNDRVSDSIVFCLSEGHHNLDQTPFFEMVLTISMHSPYDETGFLPFANINSYSKEYLKYLSACNYTDRQINNYFLWLDSIGVLDKSIIALVADHPAHDYFLKMNKSDLNDLAIPFYLVDYDHDFSDYVTPSCHQIDIYPSIVDYLGIENKWKGVGRSIFNENYLKSNCLDKEKEMSSLIIKSNFFRNHIFVE